MLTVTKNTENNLNSKNFMLVGTKAPATQPVIQEPYAVTAVLNYTEQA